MSNIEIKKELTLINNRLYDLRDRLEIRTPEAIYICNRLIEQCSNMGNLLDVHDLK